MTCESTDVLGALEDLHVWAARRQYRGHEFDDALASGLLYTLTRRSRLAQRIAIQALMSLPWDVRPLLGISPLESTKASGFYAKGYLELFQATGEDHWRVALETRLEWLALHSSPNYCGKSWGNAFPFASRAGYFPAGQPTIVWTAHIGRFFLEAYQTLHRDEYLSVAVDVARFICDGLERSEDEHGLCLAYAPGHATLIHNANLLGAALLASVSRYQDDGYSDVARQAVAWSVFHQRPEGAWAYGVGAQYDWIDNFHTAYNLDSLLYAHQALPDIVDWQVLDRGYRYWVGHFFETDGTPKYYPDRRWPLNIQCASQAISTLVLFADFFPEGMVMAQRIVAWALQHMRNADGTFMYRIHPWYRQRWPSFHWGQSTMMAALGTYYHHTLRERVGV